MVTLNAIGPGNAAAPNGWTSAPNGALETIANADDADYGYVNDNSTVTVDQGWLLDAFPGNLVNVDTLSVRVRYGWQTGTQVNTWNSISARVVRTTGGTVLAAASAAGAFQTVVGTAITTTTPTDSSLVAFSYVNTSATADDWADAQLELRIAITKNKGGDTLQRRVYAAEVSGTYTSGPLTTTAALASGAPTISAAALRKAAAAAAFPTGVPSLFATHAKIIDAALATAFPRLFAIPLGTTPGAGGTPEVVAVIDPAVYTTAAGSITVPATAQEGDLLLVWHLHGDGTAVGPTTTLPNASWSQVRSDAASGYTTFVYRALVTSGGNVDASSTQTFTSSSANDQVIAGLLIRGVDQTTPINANTGIISSSGVERTVTSTVDDCLVVGLMAVDGASSHAMSVSETATEHFDTNYPANSYLMVAGYSRSSGVAGTYGLTPTTTASEFSHTMIAVAPGAGGGSATYDIGALFTTGAPTMSAAADVTPSGAQTATAALATGAPTVTASAALAAAATATPASGAPTLAAAAARTALVDASLTSGAPALSSSATRTTAAAAALASGPPALAASATAAAVASATLASGAPTLTAAAARTAAIAAALASGAPALASDAARTATVTAALACGPPAIAATGTATLAAASALTTGPPAAAAAAARTAVASASLATLPPALAAAADIAAGVYATLTSGAPALAADTSQTHGATSALTTGPPALAGSVARTAVASAALASGVPALAADTTRATASAAALTTGPPALAADTSTGNTATATLTTGAPAAAATAARTATTSAALTAGAPTLTAAALRATDASAALTTGAPTASADATRTTTASAALPTGAPTLTAAASTAITASAALASGPPTLAAVAARVATVVVSSPTGPPALTTTAAVTAAASAALPAGAPTLTATAARAATVAAALPAGPPTLTATADSTPGGGSVTCTATLTAGAPTLAASATATTPGSNLPGQQAYRWRTHANASAALNDAAWGAAENEPVAANPTRRLRLRVAVGHDTGQTVAYKLQWRRNAGAWADVAVNSPGAKENAAAVSPVEIAANSGYADGAATTDLLTGGTGSFVAGQGKDTGITTSSIALGANTHTELEWSLWYNLHDSNSNPYFVDGDTIELRVVTSAGALLANYGPVPQITVAVPAGYVAGQAVENPARVGPWVAPNGDLYALAEPYELNPIFVMRKSVDGGDTWTPVGGASRPTAKDLEGVDGHVVGDEIWIGHFGSRTGSDGVYFHRFAMSTHATSPDTWVEVDTVVDNNNGGDLPRLDQSIAICPLPNGDIRVFYHWSSGGYRIGMRSRISGVWDTSTTGVFDPAAGSWTGVTAVVDPATSTCYVLAHNTSNGDLRGKAVTSAGVIENMLGDAATTTGTLVASNTGTGLSDRMNYTPPILWDDGPSTRLAVGWVDATSDDLRVGVVTVGTGGSVAAAVTVNDSGNVPTGTLASRMPIASLARDAVDGTLVAVYPIEATAGGDNTLHYATSSDGGATWTADAAFPVRSWGSRVGMVRAVTFTHAAGNGGARVAGIFYYDASLYEEDSGGSGAHGGYSWYDELVLAAGGTSHQAFATLASGPPALVSAAARTATVAADLATNGPAMSAGALRVRVGLAVFASGAPTLTATAHNPNEPQTQFTSASLAAGPPALTTAAARTANTAASFSTGVPAATPTARRRTSASATLATGPPALATNTENIVPASAAFTTGAPALASTVLASSALTAALASGAPTLTAAGTRIVSASAALQSAAPRLWSEPLRDPDQWPANLPRLTHLTAPGPMAAVAPRVGPPPTTAVYRAEVRDVRTGSPVGVCAISSGRVAGQFTRTLDEESEAVLTVAAPSELPGFADCLPVPWWHELIVWEVGWPEPAWRGPIVQVVEDSTERSFTILARDPMARVRRTWATRDHTRDADGAVIPLVRAFDHFAALYADAIEDDPAPLVLCRVCSGTTAPSPPTTRPGDRIGDALDRLADSSLDWAVVGNRLYVGAPTMILDTLPVLSTSLHWRDGGAQVTYSGEDYTRQVRVTGNGDVTAVWPPEPSADAVGRHQVDVNADVSDAGEALRMAKWHYEMHSKPTVDITTGASSLTDLAPVSTRMLRPGVIIPVLHDSGVLVARQDQRLVRVEVTFESRVDAAGAWGLAEAAVTIDLEPAAPGFIATTEEL